MPYAIPQRLYEIIRREAEKHDLTIEEFILEAVLNNDEPHKRAVEYIKVAEKLWGATVLAVKAYAIGREGKVIKSHRELWEYKNVLKRELGEWIQDV